MLANVTFPVIGIRGPGIAVFHSPASLTTWGDAAIQNKTKVPLRLIDAALREYQVTGVRPLAPAGRRGIRALFVPRQVHVELDIEPLEQLSLTDVVDRLIAAFDADPGFWEEHGELDALRLALHSASSFDDLVTFFS